MAIPEYPREIYKKNPLAEVICQVRFARLSELAEPNELRNLVGHRFPHLEQNIQPLAVFLEDANDVSDFQSDDLIYDFVSTDGLWTLSLCNDSLSLTCRKYERWEEFKALLDLSLQSLCESYPISKFERVGLRYLDVIQRSILGLEKMDWSGLLSKSISGELASTDLGSEIEYVSREFIFKLNDVHESRVHVRHGFATLEDDVEICYLIDSDFYSDVELEMEDAQNALYAYNQNAGRFFRWCISDILYNALKPTAP